MLVLALLFIVLPIAELAVIVRFASAYGVVNTIAVLILVSIVGAWLVKREGLSVMQRLAKSLDEGGLPHKELVDGFLILMAGLLLITPGFITDVVGILLLLPPVRIALRSMLLRSFKRRGSVAFRIVDGMGHRVTVFGGNVYDVHSEDVSQRRPPQPPRGELE